MSSLIRIVSFIIILICSLLFYPLKSFSNDVTYKVFEKQCGQVECGLRVRLNKAIYEDQLIQISTKIANDFKRNHNKNLSNIWFYLPGMTSNDLCWAQVDPPEGYKVTMNGFKAGEEDKLSQDIKSKYKGILGIWSKNLISEGYIIVLVKDEKGYQCIDKGNDGSEHIDKLIKCKFKGKDAFKRKGLNYVEYYVIDSSGKLKCYLDSESYPNHIDLQATLPLIK